MFVPRILSCKRPPHETRLNLALCQKGRIRILSEGLAVWEEYQTIQKKLVLEFSPIDIDEQQKYIWYIYLRIHTLGDEIVFLIQNKRCAVGNIVLRCMLESFVDLQCLVDDPSFVNVIKRADAESDLQYLKNYKPNNPYYQHVDQSELNEKRKELNATVQAGRKMSIEDKFKQSKNLDVYHSVYAYLNSHVHGNIASFASSSMGLSSKETQRVEFNFIFATSVKFCIASAVEVADKLNFAKVYLPEFKACLKSSKDVWEKPA